MLEGKPRVRISNCVELRARRNASPAIGAEAEDVGLTPSMMRIAAFAALVLLSLSAVHPIAMGQEPVQHGAQPNPGEVRPPSPQGDASSQTTGTLQTDRTLERPFGLPLGLALGVAALVLVVVALWIYSRRRTIGARRGGALRRRDGDRHAAGS
jgi:hypothetical protein